MPFASVSKRILAQNLSHHENVFDLQGNEVTAESHIHDNGFVGRLLFTQKQKRLLLNDLYSV